MDKSTRLMDILTMLRGKVNEADAAKLRKKEEDNLSRSENLDDNPIKRSLDRLKDALTADPESGAIGNEMPLPKEEEESESYSKLKKAGKIDEIDEEMEKEDEDYTTNSFRKRLRDEYKNKK